MEDTATYPPLDVLKEVAADVWIVDSGPLHALGLALPIRMTVIRVSSGEIWLHSPTRYDASLRAEIDALGPIRHLVAPNIAHWSFVRDWQTNCPGAASWAAPGLRRRRAVRRSDLVIDHDLTSAPPPGWADDIDQVIVRGGFDFAETVFLHKPSRTLILTDLIENFEPHKVGLIARPLLRMIGALDPHGKTPAHVRFVVNRRRREAAAAAAKMVAWQPERVILSHGRWFSRNGAAELRRAFAWLLG